MKTCTGCGEAKPLERFAKKPGTRDGLNTQCKECRNAYSRSPAGRAANIRFQRSERGRAHAYRLRRTAKGRAAAARARAAHPEHHAARYAVRSALRRGDLTRPEGCAQCGQPCRPEAHHRSYEQAAWLVVEWLCRSCHQEADRHCRITQGITSRT